MFENYVPKIEDAKCMKLTNCRTFRNIFLVLKMALDLNIFIWFFGVFFVLFDRSIWWGNFKAITIIAFM